MGSVGFSCTSIKLVKMIFYGKCWFQLHQYQFSEQVWRQPDQRLIKGVNSAKFVKAKTFFGEKGSSGMRAWCPKVFLETPLKRGEKKWGLGFKNLDFFLMLIKKKQMDSHQILFTSRGQCFSAKKIINLKHDMPVKNTKS